MCTYACLPLQVCANIRWLGEPTGRADAGPESAQSSAESASGTGASPAGVTVEQEVALARARARAANAHRKHHTVARKKKRRLRPQRPHAIAVPPAAVGSESSEDEADSRPRAVRMPDLSAPYDSEEDSDSDAAASELARHGAHHSGQQHSGTRTHAGGHAAVRVAHARRPSHPHAPSPSASPAAAEAVAAAPIASAVAPRPPECDHEREEGRSARGMSVVLDRFRRVDPRSPVGRAQRETEESIAEREEQRRKEMMQEVRCGMGMVCYGTYGWVWCAMVRMDGYGVLWVWCAMVRMDGYGVLWYVWYGAVCRGVAMGMVSYGICFGVARYGTNGLIWCGVVCCAVLLRCIATIG